MTDNTQVFQSNLQKRSHQEKAHRMMIEANGNASEINAKLAQRCATEMHRRLTKFYPHVSSNPRLGYTWGYKKDYQAGYWYVDVTLRLYYEADYEWILWTFDNATLDDSLDLHARVEVQTPGARCTAILYANVPDDDRSTLRLLGRIQHSTHNVVTCGI